MKFLKKQLNIFYIFIFQKRVEDSIKLRWIFISHYFFMKLGN